MEAIQFTDETGNQKEFYIECETRVNGKNYLLVTSAPEGDAEALILKDISDDTSEEANYVPVEDDEELKALLKVFEEMMDDTDIEL